MPSHTSELVFACTTLQGLAVKVSGWGCLLVWRFGGRGGLDSSRIGMGEARTCLLNVLVQEAWLGSVESESIEDCV